MSASVCLSVCVFVRLRSYLRNYTSIFVKFFVHITYGRGSFLLWRRSDIGISRFVAVQRRCQAEATSEANTYAALSLARRNTRCRQWTLN